MWFASTPKEGAHPTYLERPRNAQATKIYPNKARQGATPTGHIAPKSLYAPLYQNAATSLTNLPNLSNVTTNPQLQTSIPIDERQEVTDAEGKEETNLAEDHKTRVNQTTVA